MGIHGKEFSIYQIIHVHCKKEVDKNVIPLLLVSKPLSCSKYISFLDL